MSFKMTSRGKNLRYSQQTKNLIQDIMKTAKLPLKQRKIIQNHLDSGKPIPTFHSFTPYHPTIGISFASKRAKKRTQSSIITGGAYEVDKFIPTMSTMDRDKEIEKLQNIFSGFNQIQDESETESEKSVENKFTKNQRIKELMHEVEERIEFLKIMEQLGYKSKYEFDMTLEISEKLRRLENLSKQ